MRQKYVVNKQKTDGVVHEVHTESCWNLPDPHNRERLGELEDCKAAVRRASVTHSPADGCRWCCELCHTR
jgi:hypothetical protein